MRHEEIQELNEKVKVESVFISKLREEVHKSIVGQEYLVDRLLVGLLANGHVLLEGVPGLAKTLSVSTLAGAVQASFKRIQFTPDLLPADLIGTQIYNPKDATFSVKEGPVFANTFSLPELFLVLATQNPIEQEGTYPLPEAQVDRFMLKLNITYPNKKQEQEILKRMAKVNKDISVDSVIKPKDILKARELIDKIYIDEKLQAYIVDLVMATREPEVYNLDTKGYIEYGASPRATIYLTLASKAYAFIQGRGYVTPQDIKNIGLDVLRHRVIVTYEAEADDITSEDIVNKVFDTVVVP
jgi:MoxR-like ATPase